MDVWTTAFVEFTGGRDGSLISTWGQRSIWEEMQQEAPHNERFNISTARSPEGGLRKSDMINAIHRVVAAHESLRTRLRYTPSGDLNQILHGTMRLPIEIVEVEDMAAEPHGEEALKKRLLYTPFDFENEWPIRIGAVLRDSLIRHVLVVTSHHAMDAFAVPFLERTLWNGESTDDSPTFQPIDEARYQASPEGQRINAAAELYWRTTLARVPLKMFQNHSTDPRSPRYWTATLTSPRLALGLQYLSQNLRVGSSAVLLAALSAVISQITGVDQCVLLVQVHNRFKPELRHAVSPLTMPGLFMMNTASASFPELIRRGWAAALKAYQHAYYNKRLIDDINLHIERARGSRVDLSCWVNDMRSNYPPPLPLSRAKLAEIIGNLDAVQVKWSGQYDKHNHVTLGLRAYGSTQLAMLELIADTFVLAPSQIEWILQGVEGMVVDAVAATPDESG
jgi:Condensation domain